MAARIRRRDDGDTQGGSATQERRLRYAGDGDRRAGGRLDAGCGGAPLLDATATAARGAIDPEHKNGTQIGKRYVNEDGSLELLCTKPGEGSLAWPARLKLKEAKALPSSD